MMSMKVLLLMLQVCAVQPARVIQARHSNVSLSTELADVQHQRANLTKGEVLENIPKPEGVNIALVTKDAVKRADVVPATLARSGDSLLAAFLQVKSRGDADTWMSWIEHRPQEALSVFYVSFILALLVRHFSSSSAKERDKKRMMVRKRNELWEHMSALVSEMEVVLSDITESSALLAETIFEDKRRDFQRFLKWVKDDENVRSLPGLVDPLRQFVLHWLEVFRECSIKPLEKPIVPVTEEELMACGTAEEVASLALERLKRYEMRFVSKEFKRVSDKFNNPTSSMTDTSTRRDDVPRWAPSWLTSRSARVAGLVILGLCIIAFDIYAAFKAGAVAVIIATALAPTALSTIADPTAALEMEITQLTEQNSETERRHKEIREFYGSLMLVTSLWNNRTVPHFEILKEVHRMFEERPEVKLLDKGSKLLLNVKQAFGPLEIWCGENAMDEGVLMTLRTQLDDPGVTRRRCMTDKQKAEVAVIDGWSAKTAEQQCEGCRKSFRMAGVLVNRRHHCRRCGKVFCANCCGQEMKVPKLGYTIDKVKVCDGCAKQLKLERRNDNQKAQEEALSPVPSVLRKVQPLSFLHVRILRAEELPHNMFGDKPDPYVRAHVTDTTKVRTESLCNQLNPVWNETFFFAARTNDRVLFLRVYDANEKTKDSRIGTCEVKFRDIAPNTWVKMRLPLAGASHGSLELEVRFAQDAWHLR
jgi:hypothetical protein